MDVMHDRVAGLDVHKDTVVACVRTMSPRRCGNAGPMHTFGAVVNTNAPCQEALHI